MRNIAIIVVLASTLLALVACTEDAPAPAARTAAPPAGLPEIGSPIEQPQIVITPEGGAVATWTARTEGKVDVFLSRLEDGAFQPPVRVNDVQGSVNRLQIDEMRQAVATGTGGRVAVAWTDSDYNIQLNVSADGGRTFEPAVRLNRDEGDALQEFPAITFDSMGALHAVWLDPRGAGPGLEEPADLYYTHLSPEGELAEEQNLTADQESSVCGCCLPNLQALADGTLRITFRNTTPDGYRDPFQITGTPDAFGDPMRVSPPVWQIDACPVAGPIAVGNKTLWLDGSTGNQRLLSAVDPAADPEVVFEDSDEQLLLLPPRLVSGLGDESAVVLVPMADNSHLIVPEGDSWRVVADDLPFWVTSAAVLDDQLLLVGTAEGFQFESRPFDLSE